jgi:starch synthase (maltosyl-transferring)
MPSSLPADGRIRVVIENVAPAVDGGRFPIKRVAGETVTVEADCFTDGHDALACRLLYRRDDERAWQFVPMTLVVNDRWRAEFVLGAPGRYRYTIVAWVDAFLSWHHEFMRRVEADDVRIAAQVGASLIDEMAERAEPADRTSLAQWAARLRAERDAARLHALAEDESLAALAARYPDLRHASKHPVELDVAVDRKRAGFSSWYEMFPRSAGAPDKHGTFRDCEARLPYVAKMGFDVLYLPPIHPIGRERRKGRNNALTTTPADVGSPWAIGATEGGHKAIHPALGTLADFKRLVAKARDAGIEVALDIAFQCAPDHPYVKEHPEWFRWRPDGTVQYAENPPKKYQDIFPFNFESDAWDALWRELESVFEYWIEQGVRIFRVDNPHTKPFPFWEWAIATVRAKHPDVIFLAEAFTRPKVMHRLAKLGFTQSYTYFAWRNTKYELTEYFTELSKGPGREYFRPNCWPNTPDILTEYLQLGGRPAFMSRLVLAATLSANYGIYGPAYEHADNRPREPGSEEYLDSEKYQLRAWDLERPDSLAEFIGRVNGARRDNPALQSDRLLAFFPVDNDQLIGYGKITPDRSNVIVVVVNLDPHHAQSGWMELDLEWLGLAKGESYQMHDLLTGARYLWNGPRNFVVLDPARVSAHVFRVRRHVRNERDFDYFAG